MKWASHSGTRLLFASLTALVVLAVLVSRLNRVARNGRQTILTWSKDHSSPAALPLKSPQENSSIQSPAPADTPSVSVPANPGPTNSSNTSPNLIVPVAGVRPDQLRDTFSEARSEGRVHDAIDIPAPRGTRVLAAADGTIVKLFQSDRGGTTIYQLSADGRAVYYYAHLDSYFASLAEGQLVRQGETIAYVGDTGNAGPGNYHLHFSIALVSDPKKYWQGVNINPYPLLTK
jgi:peptidoglycan LD-endopeptidase LytH